MLASLAFLALAGTAPAQTNDRAIEFGIEQRVRSENWNNLFDYNGGVNDEREQVRFRTRLWTRLPLTSNIDLNLGVNTEQSYKFGQKNQWDELIFDIANVSIRNLGVRGLSLKVGRQDLMKGEGFVLFEGTPWDGSRTLYLNAAVLGYSFKKSTIEAMGILDPRSDRFLPRFNDLRKPLLDWDDQALGLYYTDRNLAKTSIESYFFHKKEVRDPRSPSNPQFQPDRRIETVGGRVRRELTKRWTATAEFARQWGSERPSTPISAWGGYSYLTRSFDARFKPFVTVGLWALSGDDPANPNRISGWDPLFSRWVKWGDLELYSQLPEKGIGYASNQKRVQFEAGFSPVPGATARFIYYHLSAFHPYAGDPNVFASGIGRGDNLQGRLEFQINPSLKGHVDFETLLPGDFYAHRGRSYFLRFEMIGQAKTLVRAAGLLPD